MRCDEIMTKNPATLTREATAQEAARLMAEKDVGFVPVIDKSGMVCGVLTDRDLAIRVLAKGKLDVKVDDIMTKEIVTCEAGHDISRCEKLMADNKISRLVIVDQKKKPVGIVSLQDLANADSDHDVGETVKKVKEEGSGLRH